MAIDTLNIIPFHKFPAYGYDEYDRRLDLEPVQDTGLLFDVKGAIGGPIKFLFDSGNYAHNDSGELAAVLDPLTVARLGYDIPLKITHGQVEWGIDLGYIDVKLIGLDDVISIPAVTGMYNLLSPYHYTPKYDIHFSKAGVSFYPGKEEPEIPFFKQKYQDNGYTEYLNLLDFSIGGMHFHAVFDTGARYAYLTKTDSHRVGLCRYPKTDMIQHSRHGDNEIGYYAPVTLTGLGTFMRIVFSPIQGDTNVIGVEQFLNDGFQFILNEAGITFIEEDTIRANAERG